MKLFQRRKNISRYLVNLRGENMGDLGIKFPNCAMCTLKTCYREPKSKKPEFCPMKLVPEIISKAYKLYEEENIRKIFVESSRIEKKGYGVWPRLREVAEFAKRLGISRLGVAFCIGLSKEAKFIVNYLEKFGFKVFSVCCKCGGIDKTEVGLHEEDKLKPGEHESMCNPILQAYLLNHVNTELNLIVGLCVGHDTLFIKYSQAPVTYLIVKDRVTGHNPAVAIYVEGYFKSRLSP